jgi:hypothetical protein
MDDAEKERKYGLDWPVVGPKLIAALEDIFWALAEDKPDEAADIIDRLFKELGPARLNLPPGATLLQDVLMEDDHLVPASMASVEMARKHGLTEEQIVKMFGKGPYR